MSLDAVVSRSIAMHWRNEAEQATVRAISMTMATCFDGITGTEVVTPYAVREYTGRRRRFKHPGCYGPTVVCDIKIDDRVWRDKYDLAHRSFYLKPVLDVVVRVRVMGARELRHSENW